MVEQALNSFSFLLLSLVFIFKNKKKKKSGKKVSEDNGNKQATEVSQTDVKNDQATSGNFFFSVY